MHFLSDVGPSKTKNELLKLVGSIFPFHARMRYIYVLISTEDSICFMSLLNIMLSKDYNKIYKERKDQVCGGARRIDIGNENSMG